MLSIGEFSRICGVSTKTLRYYDETGLLRPNAINPENGYRYYAIEQLKTMLFIDRLKAYQFSLEEIRALMEGDPTGERLGAAIAKKHAALAQQMEESRHTLQKMQQDIETIERGIPIMAYLDQIEVQLVETNPVNLLSIRKVITPEEYTPIITSLMERIGREGLTPLGAPMTLYHSTEYNPTANDTEIGIPVKEAVTGTRTLPGQLCAKSALHGPYPELRGVYARLQSWVEENGYTVCDAAYEVYVSDPATVKPEELITEVYVPVKK